MMKLGKDTGSLTNYLMSGTRGEPPPEVGMGVTLLAWTDRYAGTIIDRVGEVLMIQEDKAIRIDCNGISESQDYRYERDPNGRVRYYRSYACRWREVELGKRRGTWKLTGGGPALRLGVREAYHDYSF